MNVSSTTVEITIGYLTKVPPTHRDLSTTVEITIGYLTVIALISPAYLQQ